MIEKIFRDPVHNYIQVNSLVIYNLINTKEFQRLRRIKQLGTSSFTFHGAEHSRFSHCLGAYEIARRVSDKFERHYPNQWSPKESFLTMVAALLHDLGHGPFSHTFERLFHTDHEAVTQEIITNPETEICQILKTVSEDFPNQVASVIDHTHPNKTIVSLISSQIDVDRMDYLLRDSYYTGASYGQFDLTHILRTIRPVASGIAFDQKGMHAVEDYIIRRYQMYTQIYFHPASRSVELVLEKLLQRAKWLYQKNPNYFSLSAPKLVPFFKEITTLEDYLYLDDSILTSYFQSWIDSEDAILSDLAASFINRKLFKSLSLDEKDTSTLSALKQCIAAVGFDPDYYTGCHKTVDLPYDSYHPRDKKPRTQIDILDKHGSIVELSQLSSLVSSLTGKHQIDFRFYFPKEMLEEDDLFLETKQAFKLLLKQ